MTHEEILQLLYDETLVGNAPAVREGVKGDVHDIGKNLCNIMLEGAGFVVIESA
jgi:methanogenic corrinoid protein MtbC1